MMNTWEYNTTIWQFLLSNCELLCLCCNCTSLITARNISSLMQEGARKEATFLGKKEKHHNLLKTINQQLQTPPQKNKNKNKNHTTDTLSVFLPFSSMDSRAIWERSVRTRGHKAFFFLPRTTGFSQALLSTVLVGHAGCARLKGFFVITNEMRRR